MFLTLEGYLNRIFEIHANTHEVDFEWILQKFHSKRWQSLLTMLDWRKITFSYNMLNSIKTILV